MRDHLPSLRAGLRLAALAAPWLLAAYGLVLNAGIARPIWYDEFIHFALAAEPSTAEAWHTASLSFRSLNHGQTGAYLMANYWTLALTGSSALALRLPSLLSAGFMLGSAILLFRLIGFSVAWQLVLVAALLGQHMLMYFAGEARPYMPLAAAAVGLLAYYVGRAHRPASRALHALGAAAALLGVLMHPYIALYWPAAWLVGLLHLRAVSEERITLRRAILFANPPLVVAGIGLFLAVAAATWLGPSPSFGFDPLFWLRRSGFWTNFTDYSHTQFLAERYAWAIALTAVATAGLWFLPAAARPGMRRLGAPLALAVAGFALSGIASWLSYRAGYWILGRQWVASSALVAVGVVWFWAELARIWRAMSPLPSLAILGVAAWVVVAQVANIHAVRVAEIQSALEKQRARRDGLDCTPPAAVAATTLPRERRDALWVELAVRNIDCGGPPWQVFRGFHPLAIAEFPQLLEHLARLPTP